MATISQLINDSLLEIGVGALGEDTEVSVINHALRELNRMWSSWAAKIKPLYTSTLVTHTWPSGEISQTIGSGGDISAQRPVIITGFQTRLDDLDYTLEQVSYEQFESTKLKTVETDYPEVFAYQRDYPLATIYIYPVPVSALTARIQCKLSVGDFELNDTISLPEGYEAALSKNLAVCLAGVHGKAVRPQLALEARNTLARIENVNEDPIEMYPDPFTPGISSLDNIDLLTNK